MGYGFQVLVVHQTRNPEPRTRNPEPGLNEQAQVLITNSLASPPLLPAGQSGYDPF